MVIRIVVSPILSSWLEPINDKHSYHLTSNSQFDYDPSTENDNLYLILRCRE